MAFNTTALGRAARQPLAILILLAAFAGGAIISWWLLPLGIVAYAGMVVLGAMDATLQRPAPAKISRPRLTSNTFRSQIEAIEQTANQIARSIAQTPEALRQLLGRIEDQARQLTSEAYLLADKGQTIEQYLSGVNTTAIQKQIEAIDIRLRSTRDSYTVQQLDETRQALLDRQGNARDLETYIGRISAQLQNIAATLENVLAETVRLRTADAVSADAVTSQTAQRLSDLKADMDAFQRVLDTALTQTTA